MNANSIDHLRKNRQEQLLKLVAKSFHRELVNYGVDSGDIITVSLHLLDRVTENQRSAESGNGYFNTQFLLRDIQDNWKKNQLLRIDQVHIIPLLPEQISQICQWLSHQSIQETFIKFFPETESELAEFLLGEETRQYFAIYSDNHFVGAIGAENIDFQHKKLEMKKFVGNTDFGGKGIGKRATFLFLYYAFMILGINKVYIHSMDTNIRNINLNSKFGFELEGIFFQEILREKKFLDVVRMGLLKTQWLSIFSLPKKQMIIQ